MNYKILGVPRQKRVGLSLQVLAAKGGLRAFRSIPHANPSPSMNPFQRESLFYVLYSGKY